MNSLDIPDDTIDTLEIEQSLADVSRARPVLEKIADKWTVLILTVLCPKPSRFNAIKSRLDGITHKALSDTLKRLERNGLVTRTVLLTQPVGVQYAITPLGASLREPFDLLCAWSLAHGEEIKNAQLSYDLAKDVTLVGSAP
jgi:DNA-binding HxlR family transcriptional regulator